MCMKTDIGTLIYIIFWEKSQKMFSVSNKRTGDFWCVLARPSRSLSIKCKY